jgi:hypothetical protein
LINKNEGLIQNQSTGFHAFSLGLLTILLRVPFTSKILYHWDSVNFAFSITEFSIAKEQPHPPGYILYVYLIRLLNTFINNPNSSMVVVSIVSSGLAVACLYLLALRLFGRKVAFISGIFLITSPLYWFYGEIALPHALDAALAILCAYLLFEAQKNVRYGYWAIVVLAVTGGFRPQTLVFLMPLAAFSLARWKGRNIIFWLLLGFGVCLAWFMPMINLNGGLQQYLTVFNQFSARFQTSTSVLSGAGWGGLTRNGIKLAIYTLYSLGFSAFGVIGFLTNPASRTRSEINKYVFLIVWILPAFLYYFLVHMGQQGLVFIFLPALLMILAAGLQYIYELSNKIGIAFFLTIAILNSAIFLSLPEYPFGRIDGQRFLTRQTIDNNDRFFIERIESVNKRLSNKFPIIVAENWRHVQFYLPDTQIIGFEPVQKWEANSGELILKEGQEFKSLDWLSDESKNRKNLEIIFFDLPVENVIMNDLPGQSFSKESDEGIEILSIKGPVQFSLNGNWVYVRPK